MEIKNIKPNQTADSKSKAIVYQVIVDTPQGSRNKYEYDEEQELLREIVAERDKGDEDGRH